MAGGKPMQPMNYSSMESIWLSLRITLFGASPSILVCLWGIIVSILRRSRHPSVSLLTSIGLGLLLLNRVVVGTLNMWLPRYLQEKGWEIRHAYLMNGSVAFLGNIVAAIALGLVVRAVFIGREKIYWEREGPR
jgi:hypothetical protein